MEALNAFQRVIGFQQAVFGTVALSGSTASLSQLSGEALSDQTQVTIADDGTGDFTLSVTNFRGANGYLMALATATTISVFVSCVSQSYTANTDTANFQFNVENDASTATDAGFNFMLLAF